MTTQVPDAVEFDGRSAASGSRWIHSTAGDLLLIIGGPLLLAPLLWLQRWNLSDVTLPALILAFAGLGHHAAGYLRCYGDRELFSRYRRRLVLVPLLLLPLCVLFAVRDLVGVQLIVLGWWVWHVASQTSFLAGVYGARAGTTDRLTRLLERGMCLGWYVTAVLASPDRLGEFLGRVFRAGLSPSTAVPLDGLRWAGWLFTLAVTLWAVGRLVSSGLGGRPVSLQRLGLLVLSIGFFWYCLVGVQDLVVGLAMYELFHALQYLVMARGMHRGAGRMSVLVFRRGVGPVAILVLLVLAYGALGFAADRATDETLKAVLLGVIAASMLLHFYLDGFIWSHDEPAESVGTASVVRGRAAVVHWVGFAVLAGVLAVGERGRTSEPLEIARGVVRVVPDSTAARTVLARVLIANGRSLEAIDVCNETIRRGRPSYRDWMYRGIARRRVGKAREGLEDLRTALGQHRRDADLRYELGLADREDKRPDNAVRHFEASIDIRPHNPDAHYQLALLRFEASVATVFDRPGLKRAQRQVHTALEQNPDHLPAMVLSGELWRILGDEQRAVEQLQAVLDTQRAEFSVAHADAHRSLSRVLADRGEFDESNRHLAVAARIFAWRAASSPALLPRLAEVMSLLLDRAGRDDPGTLELVALGRAATGDWSVAVRTAEQALEQARSAGRSALAQRLRRQLADYRARKFPESELPRPSDVQPFPGSATNR